MESRQGKNVEESSSIKLERVTGFKSRRHAVTSACFLEIKPKTAAIILKTGFIKLLSAAAAGESMPSTPGMSCVLRLAVSVYILYFSSVASFLRTTSRRSCFIALFSPAGENGRVLVLHEGSGGVHCALDIPHVRGC